MVGKSIQEATMKITTGLGNARQSIQEARIEITTGLGNALNSQGVQKVERKDISGQSGIKRRGFVATEESNLDLQQYCTSRKQ